MPTEAIKITTGMALSLMPIRPMMPNNSTVIMAKINTWKEGVERKCYKQNHFAYLGNSQMKKKQASKLNKTKIKACKQ